MTHPHQLDRHCKGAAKRFIKRMTNRSRRRQDKKFSQSQDENAMFQKHHTWGYA